MTAAVCSNGSQWQQHFAAWLGSSQKWFRVAWRTFCEAATASPVRAPKPMLAPAEARARARFDARVVELGCQCCSQSWQRLLAAEASTQCRWRPARRWTDSSAAIDLSSQVSSRLIDLQHARAQSGMVRYSKISAACDRIHPVPNHGDLDAPRTWQQPDGHNT